MSIDRKKPEIIKHAWQSKQKTEIDMTTTGSSLIQENIRIYAERLITMEFKGRGRTGESSGDIQDKRRQRLIKEITYALHELRGLVELQDAVGGIQTDGLSGMERKIKQIVAAMEYMEVCGILDKHVLPQLSEGRRNTIVDMASGIGRFLNYFSANFEHVIEIDFVESNVSLAMEKHASLHNVEFIVGDLMDVQLPKASVNLFFGNWLLQYLQEDEILELLPRLLGCLATGGLVFFHEGIIANFEGRLPDKKENPAIFRSSASMYKPLV